MESLPKRRSVDMVLANSVTLSVKRKGQYSCKIAKHSQLRILNGSCFDAFGIAVVTSFVHLLSHHAAHKVMTVV